MNDALKQMPKPKPSVAVRDVCKFINDELQLSENAFLKWPFQDPEGYDTLRFIIKSVFVA